MWLRVSTTRQQLRAQRHACMRFAEARGLEVAATFEEVGISGAAAGRQVPAAVLDGVRRGRWSVVLVFRLDRAFRSASRAVLFLDEVAAANGRFVSVEDGIDTGSPMGQAMAAIASVLAQLERETIGARIREGLAAARAAGVQLGRRRHRADAAQAAKLRLQNLSWPQIARRLRCSIGTARRRAAEGLAAVKRGKAARARVRARRD